MNHRRTAEEWPTHREKARRRRIRRRTNKAPKPRPHANVPATKAGQA